MPMCRALVVNGERVTPENLSAWRSGRRGIEADLADFLAEWWGPGETVCLHSSGSTGKPKEFAGRKEYMRASAVATLRAFGLWPCSADADFLLCLPLRYIAGKMMVVRALEAGCRLRVVEPSSAPIPPGESFDFAAMVPMQAVVTLSREGGAAALSAVRTLLLGGGFVDAETEAALQGVDSAVYVSYGMTETYSHIALRRLNGSQAQGAYHPLPGVSLALSPEGTLVINAPHIGVQGMETNDVAEFLPDSSFRILGRRDAVINSGGIKIQAEQVEAELRRLTGLTVLALPHPHPVLGQCIELLWEGPAESADKLSEALERLPKYQRPAVVRRVDALPRTATGKLCRVPGAR